MTAIASPVLEPPQRSSRRTRVADRAVRFRERDVDILLALAKMRLLKTSDIGRLFFHAIGTAQKRLRKLFDAGLVRAVVPELAAENRYALTKLGHGFLVEAAEADVPPFRPIPRIDQRGAAHLDLLNRYRIALATSVAAHGLELARFRPEWELRALDLHSDLVPDALFELTLRGQTRAFALEIDLGTEAPGTVKKKLERYAANALMKRPVAGTLPALVVLIAHLPRRARSLARTLEGFDELVLLGATSSVIAEGGLLHGLARAKELAREEGAIASAVFRHGLLDAFGARRAPRSCRTHG